MADTQSAEIAPRRYYKATRPDGLSFHGDPPVSYTHKDGTPRTSVIRPAPFDGEPRLCGPGMLHVSTEPGETLVGGSWPCRLFEVEPVGEPLASERHKVGFAGLRIVREVEAWRALGPNGEHVAALIERAKMLTLDEAGRLEAAWDAARDAAWYAARYAAWDAARDAARDAAWDAARYAARDAAWYAARYAAWDAARDAAWALVIRDLIPAEHYDALTLPWRQIVGPIHPDDERRIPPAQRHDHRARFCTDRPEGMEWTTGIRCLRCDPLPGKGEG